MSRSILAVALIANAVVAAAASDIPTPRLVDVAALVRQLGSNNFAEREAASKRLSTLKTDEVPPELLAALKSSNPEVRQRAARAIPLLQERIALARLPRGDRFAKRGQVDLYVASTATSYPDAKPDDDRLWNPVLEVGRLAVKKTEMKEDRAPRGCPIQLQDIAEYKKVRKPKFTRVYEHYSEYRWYKPEAIQALSVGGRESFSYHIVITRGPINTGGGINQTLILATGDIGSADGMANSVIICDGNVHVVGNAFKNLIITRGNILINGIASTNTLIAGGTVTISKPQEPGSEFAEMLLRNIIKEKEKNPLNFITFFELHRIGLEVKAADKVVRVSAVAVEKPCSEAGLKVGDTILEVNGKKPDSAESLRRLLRDALAIGDATVKLQRGNNTLTVKVSLPE